MLSVKIPGCDPLNLSHLVLDYNGTIAVDGHFIDGVEERLRLLAESLTIHILTADTFGSVREVLAGIPCRLEVIRGGNQAEAKRDYVAQLGLEHCVCIGNGRNDRLMLKEATLGIVVVQAEGAAVEAVCAADIVANSIMEALDLLSHPLRLAATLRS